MAEFSAEEIASWTTATVRAEILRILPKGWQFREHNEEGWFHASVGNAEAVFWHDMHADERILLLNLFGWLWLRNSQPKNPAWRLRPAAPRSRVGPTQGGPRSETAEPPDLEPSEIDPLVYPSRKEKA